MSFNMPGAIVGIWTKEDVIENLKKIISYSDPGYEGTVSFDNSGFGLRVICYDPKGSNGMFPPADKCAPPLRSSAEVYDHWHEMWGYVTSKKPDSLAPRFYLEAFNELGYLMALSFECPFDTCWPGLKKMFCFTDGVVGVFMFLTYKEALKIEEE